MNYRALLFAFVYSVFLYSGGYLTRLLQDEGLGFMSLTSTHVLVVTVIVGVACSFYLGRTVESSAR